MIKNYLIITFRNFFKNRNYTLINVLGLSIGITSCIIIFLLVTYDLSFDKFHSRYNQIHRIVLSSVNSSGIDYSSATPYPMAKAFRNDFTDVPLVTQIHYSSEALIKIETEKYRQENVLFADSLFFEVFDFQVLSGNPKADLGQPGKVFVTQSFAENKLKGRTSFKLDNKLELEVAGIVADPPSNSHIHFEILVSMPSLTSDFLGFPIDNWGMTIAGYTYIVLPETTTQTAIEERFKPFAKKYYSQEDAARRTLLLQPLNEIHFDKQYTGNPGSASNAELSDLIVMSVLGMFILAIACVNFINLATALAIKKSKEIGIRKTLGAKRSQLTAYFLGETFLITLFSVLISLCAVEWFLGWINRFMELKLELNLFSNPTLILFLIALLVFATLLSGFYPAIILSGFQPLAVLKNKITAHGSSGATVRKVLVVFQFMIAQILIIGTLIVADQMNYFKSKPLGFTKDAIVNVPLPENKKETLESFRQRLESHPDIQGISFSLGAPTSDNNFSTNFFLTEKGKDEMYNIAIKTADRNYLGTYGIKLKAGRWFTEAEEKQMDTSLPKEQRFFHYVLNESAAKKLGFSKPEDIIGKFITTGLNNINAEVIGVVEDFHTASLHDAIVPTVLVCYPGLYYDAGIKINTQNFSKSISFIEENWSQIYPEYDFEYEFLDQYLSKLYKEDDRTFTLFKLFAGISIFIGCLGLYGLISFMANQKLKEVGIRKVLGASIGSIMILFSKEFVKLIMIAFVIAAPLAWYSMNEWLSGFAYRIPIQWTVFVVGIVSTLLIALLTVSYRSAQAAVSNPAETLRSE